MKRIKLEERIEIYHLLENKESLRKISKILNRSVSSISYEIKQGKVNGKYNPIIANKRSKRKAKSRRFGKRKIDNDHKLKSFIFNKIIKEQ